jgi:hypothetical protein
MNIIKKIVFLLIVMSIVIFWASCAGTTSAPRSSLKSALKKEKDNQDKNHQESDSTYVSRKSDESYEDESSNIFFSFAWEIFKAFFLTVEEPVEDSIYIQDHVKSENFVGNNPQQTANPVTIYHHPSEIAKIQKGFVFGYSRGILNGNDLRDPLTIHGGIVTNILYPVQVELFFSYVQTSLLRGSEYGSQIDEYQSTINFGMNLRYLIAKDDYPRFYLLGGTAVNSLGWTYKTPLLTQHQNVTEEIWDDGVTGYTVKMGAGWFPFYYRHFAVSFEMTAGATMWGKTTNQGYMNDVFSNNTYLLWGIRLFWFR